MQLIINEFTAPRHEKTIYKFDCYHAIVKNTINLERFNRFHFLRSHSVENWKTMQGNNVKNRHKKIFLIYFHFPQEHCILFNSIFDITRIIEFPLSFSNTIAPLRGLHKSKFWWKSYIADGKQGFNLKILIKIYL